MKRFLLFGLFNLFAFSLYAQWYTKGPYGAELYRITSFNSTIFTGGSYLGIFRSKDKGETWESVANGLPKGRFNVMGLQSTSKAVYVLLGDFSFNDLYRSTDNGDTWVKVSAGFNLDYGLLRTVGDDIYVQAKQSAGIIKSTDQGQTWTSFMPGSSSSRCILFGPSKVFVADCGLFYSEDQGQSWKYQNSNLNHCIERLHEINGTLLAACGDSLFISTDDGASWNNCNLPVSSTQLSTRYYVENIAGVLYANSCMGIFASNDGGHSWQLKSQDLYDKALGPAIVLNSEIYITTGLGIYKSTDQCLTWTSKNSGLLRAQAVNEVINVSNDYYGSGNDGLYRFTEGVSSTWELVNRKIKAKLLFSMGDTLYTNSNDSIIKSTDRGVSWKYSSKLPGSNFWRIWVNGNDFYSIHQNEIYRSSSYGQTWVRADQGLPSSTKDLLASTSAGLFTVLDDKLYKSTDKGANWTQVAGNIPQSKRIYRVLGDQDMLYIPSDSGLYSSSDFGINWAYRKIGNKPVGSVHYVLLNKGKLFASTSIWGSPGRIYLSTDDGITWGDITSNLYNASGAKTISVAGDFIFTTDIYQPIYQLRVNTLHIGIDKLEQNVFSIYPNPSSRYICISTNGNFKIIELYSADGRLLSSLPFRKEVDLTNMKAGTYFVRLIGNAGKLTQKLILQ